MFVEEPPRTPPSLIVAIALSLLLHGLVLFVSRQPPESQDRPARRIEASLATPQVKPKPITPPAAVPATTPAQQSPAKAPVRKKVLAVDKSKAHKTSPSKPEWSVAQKQEMNKFLKELEDPRQPPPDLAQRSLAMAREYGREQARHDESGEATLERLPNSPPVDPFSLEMYLDALVKKLNRSAGFVRNDPRSKGVKSALVQVKINPDGSLRSFKVLNAGDQQAEISFIKSVVEQAVPFAAFPADMRRSARSLGMMICIMPPSLSGGFGFGRSPDGGKC